MNDQPSHTQFRAPSFGAPSPAPSGAGRLLPLMRTAATGGLLVALGLYAAQLFLPYNLKPSVVAGRAAGDTVASETETMRNMKVAYEREITDAHAQANAKSQADLAAIQTVLAERTASLEPVSTLAGVADLTCLGGHIVASLAAAFSNGGSWRGPDMSADINKGARAVSAATCGLGDGLRQAVTQSQLEAVRTAAAARGAPMTDGSVQVASVPQAEAPQPIVVPASPYSRPTPRPAPRISADERDELRAYAQTLPVEVRQSFTLGLDSRNATYWADFYDRVADYRASHKS